MASPEEQRAWQTIPALAGGPSRSTEEWLRRSIVQRVPEIARPVLLQYASDDAVVTEVEMERLAAALRHHAADRAEVHRFEAAGGHRFNRSCPAEGEPTPIALTDSWSQIWDFLETRLEWTAPDAGGD